MQSAAQESDHASLAAVSLPKTRIRGVHPETAHRISGRSTISSTSWWGCGHFYDGTASARVVGKNYPYGQERPSATANGTEKFTGYMRDAETGLDYSDQRYHSPGTGRFLTTDPSSTAHPTDPNSWNQYAYVGGDPINRTDPAGLDYYFSSDPYTDPSTGSTFTWGVSFSVGSYGVSVNPFYNISPLDLQAYEDNSDYSFGHRFDGTTRAPASFAQRRAFAPHWGQKSAAEGGWLIST